MSAENETREWWSKYWNKLLGSIIVLPIIMHFWPQAVPFKFFELWKVKGAMIDWLIGSWPLLLWGTALATLAALSMGPRRRRDPEVHEFLIGGTLHSLFAGVTEEIAFRWLFFMSNIVSVQIANYCFFGFLGFGITEWFHMHLVGPIANWATFKALEPYIFHSSSWAVGASIIATNTFFRDGHKYQGFFGWVNSWFGGMFLFWIMFKFGLPIAILVHFLYDFLFDIIPATHMAMRRK